MPRGGAQQAGIVDTAMREEAIVLRGQHGVDDLFWNGLVRQRNATLLAELGDQLAVTRVHAQRHLQLDIADRRDVRQ